MKVYNQGLPDRSILCKGGWEHRQVEFFFNKALDFGATRFLDIGAHFGYWSLLAGKLGIFDSIHAFEPVPHIYERLEWHISNNNLKTLIIPYKMALSNKTGEAHMRGIHGAASGASLASSSLEHSQLVPTELLDSILKIRGEKLALKIDVEDHEIPMLQGGLDLLSNNRIFLQTEVHEDQVGTIDFLLSLGFKLIKYINEEFYFVND